MGTKTPSTTDPLRLKYHEIAFKFPDWQSKEGVKPPEALFKAEVSSTCVKVFVVLGVIPALDNQT